MQGITLCKEKKDTSQNTAEEKNHFLQFYTAEV